MKVAPPPLARWLVWLFVPRPLREPVLGDLSESHNVLAARESRQSADSWYWGQTVRCIPVMVRWRVWHGPASRALVAIVIGWVTYGLVFSVLAGSLSAILPASYLAEIRHIGKGVVPGDPILGGLGVLAFLCMLFVAGAVAGGIFASIARQSNAVAIAVFCGCLFSSIPVGWMTGSAPTGFEWLQLVWLAVSIFAVSTGVIQRGRWLADVV